MIVLITVYFRRDEAGADLIGVLISCIIHDPLDLYRRFPNPLPALLQWHFGIDWDAL